jgi:hypothetical protein
LGIASIGQDDQRLAFVQGTGPDSFVPTDNVVNGHAIVAGETPHRIAQGDAVAELTAPELNHLPGPNPVSLHGGIPLEQILQGDVVIGGNARQGLS